MTDIPEEFQDVPRLPNGKPDFRTKRGKKLKAWLESKDVGRRQAATLESQRSPGNPNMPKPFAVPMDGGGTEPAGDERFPQEGLPTAEDVRGIIPFVPQPPLGTSKAGQWLLEAIAEEYPEVRYNQWNRVKATFVHAQRNLLAWRRLTQGR